MEGYPTINIRKKFRSFLTKEWLRMRKLEWRRELDRLVLCFPNTSSRRLDELNGKGII